LSTTAILALVTIAGTWAGYPFAIWLLRLLQPESKALAPGEYPAVSVIIASRESAEAVCGRVKDCLAAAYPPDRLEVVVALDRPREAPDAALLTLPQDRVRVVRADPPGGKAAALNAGVAAASGEVLVFADTFQRFKPDTVRRLVDGLADPRIGAASGSLELASGSAPLAAAYWAYERWLRRSEAAVHSAVGVSGAVYAMHRHLWQPLPVGLLLDDLYTPMRLVLAGWRVGFIADARAVELRLSAPAREYQRKVRTLTGVIQVCAWLPEVLLPWRNPVWPQFVMHKLMRMLTPVAVILLGIWADCCARYSW
jgi:poly-beta-1,6-N-acetyl-D-glucosamine synthase